MDKILPYILFIFTPIFSVYGQNSTSHFYHKIVDDINEERRIYGDFNSNEHFIVGGSGNDYHQLIIFNINSERQLTKAKTIKSSSGRVFMDFLMVDKDTIFIAASQETAGDTFSLRLIILTTDLETVFDTTFQETQQWGDQFTTYMIKNQQNEVILLGKYVPYIANGNFLVINKINTNGQVIQTKFINAKFGYSIQESTKNEYLLSSEYLKDSSGNVLSRHPALILDSNFEITGSLHMDSTTTPIFTDWDNQIQVFTSLSFTTHFGSAIYLKNQQYALISGFVADTFNMRNPGGPERSNYMMRVALLTREDSLISEKFIYHDNWVKSAYNNSAQFPDGSFLAFGVAGAGSDYNPLLPFRSSFVLSKFDSQGGFLWKKEYSHHDRYYHGCQVRISNSGQIALIGTAYDYQNTQLNLAYVLFLDSEGNLLDSLNSNFDFNVDVFHSNPYPNPAKSSIQFDLSNNVESTIVIYDSFGREITEYKASGKFQMDVSNFKSGMYYYSITKEGIYTLGKFLKVD